MKGGMVTVCSVCKERQFNTPAGVSCSNGHGGAEGELALERTNVGSDNLSDEDRKAMNQDLLDNLDALQDDYVPEPAWQPPLEARVWTDGVPTRSGWYLVEQHDDGEFLEGHRIQDPGNWVEYVYLDIERADDGEVLSRTWSYAMGDVIDEAIVRHFPIPTHP